MFIRFILTKEKMRYYRIQIAPPLKKVAGAGLYDYIESDITSQQLSSIKWITLLHMGNFANEKSSDPYNAQAIRIHGSFEVYQGSQVANAIIALDNVISKFSTDFKSLRGWFIRFQLGVYNGIGARSELKSTNSMVTDNNFIFQGVITDYLPNPIGNNGQTNQVMIKVYPLLINTGTSTLLSSPFNFSIPPATSLVGYFESILKRAGLTVTATANALLVKSPATPLPLQGNQMSLENLIDMLESYGLLSSINGGILSFTTYADTLASTNYKFIEGINIIGNVNATQILTDTQVATASFVTHARNDLQIFDNVKLGITEFDTTGLINQYSGVFGSSSVLTYTGLLTIIGLVYNFDSWGNSYNDWSVTVQGQARSL